MFNKISLITTTFNSESTIERCIRSVIAQNYANLEYIIVDGGSTDFTLQIINQYKENIQVIISEADHGVYDAMNKGIEIASGEIVGTLNADDYFAAEDILLSVGEVFSDPKINILYGHLDYIKADLAIARKWRAKKYNAGLFNWGWMPPHPTFYCRRKLFEKFGNYSLEYGTAADYELMLRFIHFQMINATLLKKVMVNMQLGGMSNLNLQSRVSAWKHDLRAMRNNGIYFPVFTLILKPIRKLGQYL